MEIELSYPDFIKNFDLFKVLEIKTTGDVKVTTKGDTVIFNKVYSNLKLNKFINDSVIISYIPTNHLFPLNNIICSSVDKKRTFCTAMSQQIASSMVRIASSRIFSMPEQSLLELPVNSIDSYNRINDLPQIGKFGMGFFSMLYWLIGKPENRFSVTSRYFFDKRLIEYQLYIIWTPLGFNCQLNELPDVNLPFEGTGTRVRLFAPTLTNFNSLIFERLQDVENIDIQIVNFMLPPRISEMKFVGRSINNVSSSQKVMIGLNSYCIDVIDQAEGIPLATVYNSLLIPSSSTKTIRQSSEHVGTKDKTRFHMNESFRKSNLYITVNNIRVVDIQVENDLNCDYIISMPSNTKLPVARDDIILEKNSMTSKIFEVRLCNLVVDVLEKMSNLTVLYQLLDKYCQWSGQSGLVDAVQNVKNIILNMRDNSIKTSKPIYFIPIEHKVYSIIAGEYPELKLVYYPEPDLIILEEQLLTFFDDIIRTDIIELKSLVPLKLLPDNYTTGGMNQLVFVNKKFITENSVAIMISSCTEFIPIPAGSQISLQTKKHITNIIQKMPEDITKSLQILYLTFKAIFENVDCDIDKVIVNIIESFLSSRPQYDDINNFIKNINGKISQIKLNFAYGTSPIIYHVLYNTILYTPIWFDFKVGSTKDGIALHKIIGTHFKVDDLTRRLMFWTISNIMLKNLGNAYILPNFSMLNISNMQFKKLNGLQKAILFCTEDLSVPEVMVYLACLQNMSCGKQDISSIGPFLINQIRSRASSFELFYMVLCSISMLSSQDNILSKVMLPVILAINSYIQFDRVSYFSLKDQDYKIFSAKSLITYVFENELDDDWLVNVSKTYTSFREKDLNLQVVEIAVNEGTTKEYMIATLTELVQNSIDAIRSSGVKDNSINIQTKNNLISVSDSVGFPVSAIPAILIPFLSTKSKDDPLVTGEMGSGFFVIYRYPWCKEVRIISHTKDNLIKIISKPIILNDRVIDIEYSVSVIKNTSKMVGTQIQIYINNITPEIQITATTTAQIFVRNRLAFSDIPIKLNGVLVSEEKILAYENEVGQFYIQSNYTIPSCVTTNGIPFSDIKSLFIQFPKIYTNFKEDSDIGIIINFNKTFYTPVQSRTRIVMSPYQEDIILKFLNDGFYFALLSFYNSGIFTWPDRLISNTSSTQNVHHLLMSETKFGTDVTNIVHMNLYYGNFLAYYCYNTSEETVGDIINRIIKKGNITESLVMLNSREQQLQIVYLAVKVWFRNKNKDNTLEEKIEIVDKKESSVLDMSMSSVVSDVSMGIPFRSLQSFVDIFWKLGNKFLPDIISGKPPLLICGESKNGYLGYYMSGKIILNNDYFPYDEIDAQLERIKKLPVLEGIGELRSNKLTKKLFSIGQPANVLIHEILHAVRDSSHMNINGHNAMNITIHDTKKEYEFDEAAILIYTYLNDKGLLMDFFLTPFISSDLELSE